MRLQKTAEGKTQLTITKEEWTRIGNEQGWMKQAKWGKGAKLLDIFSLSQKKFEEFADKFVKDYFDRVEKMPTVGDVIKSIMHEPSLRDENITQDFMKTIAQMALARGKSPLAQI